HAPHGTSWPGFGVNGPARQSCKARRQTREFRSDGGEHLSLYRASKGRQRCRRGRSYQEPEPCELQVRQCVVLSFDKLVAQPDCSTAEDGTKVVLQDLPGVEGVVQTNVVAVVEPVH